MPQMLRFALPGLGNVWMVLIKATSLMSVIQLPELMRMADVAARAVRMPFTFYFGASVDLSGHHHRFDLGPASRRGLGQSRRAEGLSDGSRVIIDNLPRSPGGTWLTLQLTGDQRA